MQQSELKALIHYDPGTGIFTWNKARRGVRVGARTGCVNAVGYVVIGLNKKIYTAHRLAWLYMTGEWPAETIDHANRDRKDNRWANLRAATYSQNNANTGLRCNNSSGVTGVSFNKAKRLWRAYIGHGGRQKFVGYYKSAEEAAAARARAEKLHFGEFRLAA